MDKENLVKEIRQATEVYNIAVNDVAGCKHQILLHIDSIECLKRDIASVELDFAAEAASNNELTNTAKRKAYVASKLEAHSGVTKLKDTLQGAEGSKLKAELGLLTAEAEYKKANQTLLSLRMLVDLTK